LLPCLHSFPTRRSSDLKAFSRDRTVDMTEAMACSALLRAAPANHRALWSGGSLPIRSWKWLLPLTPLGSRRSCTSLNTETMCRRSEEHTSELQSRFDLV